MMRYLAIASLLTGMSLSFGEAKIRIKSETYVRNRSAFMWTAFYSASMAFFA